jgi:endoglucanase
MKATMWTILAVAGFAFSGSAPAAGLHLTDSDYLSEPGLDVLVYQNEFHPVFHDQKISGIEIILHGERLATDGEVRLLPTPQQWDAVPKFYGRKRGTKPGQLIVTSGYPEHHLKYRIEVTAEEGGFRVAVDLDKPLPAKLAGKAGFNLDFLPTDYFGKSYILDSGAGVFPRHPESGMKKNADGTLEPLPMASGRSITLSPEDPLTQVNIVSETGPLMLYDERTMAQNGWFVVRTLIPAGRTKNAVVWHVRPHVVPGWTRPPMVAFNQVGYTPGRSKVAIVELDPAFHAPDTAALMRVEADGSYKEVYRAKIKPWGKWLRYDYATFDFSPVHEPGIYAIAYAGHTFNSFRIAPGVYDGIWHHSIDTYLAEQMDHVAVRENYRVWHGPSHLDDARQAPPNHKHFDGYAMGAELDSPYPAGAHIPGLNVGGWFDAGDYDIRTESQDFVVRDLVMTRELFGADWDNLTVDEAARSVEIRKPDGIPDIVEQVKHGALAILAQYKVFGHAIPGIIAPTLQEYTHLGDAGSKTDRMIYSAKMGPLENDGVHSGVPDDRWAFTTHTTPLNYDAAASLAAASRVLRGYDDALAKDCLDTALKVWADEHASKPVVKEGFNTQGGDLDAEETLAAVELVLATKGRADIAARLKALLPAIHKNFFMVGAVAVRAIPYMDDEYRQALKADVLENKTKLDAMLAKTPFGVPVMPGPWAGSALVAALGAQMYVFHQAFPDVVGTGYVLDSLDYLLGRHAVNNLSLVSGEGTASKLVGYGNNRADYTFIPGGVVPGVLIVKPDFPELKTKWPFLWYENEYVVGDATAFVLAANAAAAVTKAEP